jgi:predicted TIM-barrel fold metal-dependent hydrolase
MSKAARDKGKRGERMFRDLCREQGFIKTERTGWHQSFAGDAAADVTIPELPTLWPEVKFVEKLNVRAAFEQAEKAAAIGKTPAVFHKTSAKPWLVTLAAEDFFGICRRSDLVDLTENGTTPGAPDVPSTN